MMNFKFSKQALVKVTDKHGRILSGKVVDVYKNLCTYKEEYDIEVVLNGKSQIIIGVPVSSLS